MIAVMSVFISKHKYTHIKIHWEAIGMGVSVCVSY